ncbi:putative aldouronate transport system substrate-binding protein [Paenibacillus catalpae]|uniref:Putative aldouronate transport system substrate-binding protein n=1 Tax=Paenibacillus catalpae TaxID=1045775 RepID=A0A1I1XTX0_9BACL|nr:ABC transporter substrate-binding protein [Paenibacillus catalpae]SFE10797.1 putative aldouronate transport system substrate-binding protein [Paenibacillus catalpae]
MKLVKHSSAVLMSVILILVLALTGCSGNNKTNDEASHANAAKETNASSEPAATGGDAKKLDPYEVVMVYPDAPQSDLASVQTAMNDYLNAAYPELSMTVKLNPIDWGAWGDKTNLMMASNEKFDLFFTADWLGYNQQVLKGGLLPLDDLLAEYGPDIEAVEKDFHEPAKRGGKLYGIHTHQELGGSQGIYLDKALVDKYSMDLSALKSGKVEDLELLLQTIKENEPDVTPLVAPSFPLDAYYTSGTLDTIASAAAINILDTDPSSYDVVNFYETPRYKELADLMYKWFKAGYVNKDALTPGLDAWKKIQAGKGFALVGDMEILADMEIGSVSKAPNASIKAGREMIQIPLNIDRLQTGKMTATMQAISKTSKDPARAMMLLNLFFKDQKLLTLFNFGVEGKHYALKNGQIALPEGKTTNDVGFYHDIMWQIGNQMLNYTREGEDPNKYKNYEKFNEMISSRAARTFGFIFDPEPVKNEIIAIDNANKAFVDGLKSGQLNPEENLPKLLAKQKAAGVDKVIAEAQKQIDAWRAANGK